MSEFENERAEWDDAWSKVQHKELQAWDSGALEQIVQSLAFGSDVSRITITTNPPQFVDRVWRENAICLRCGKSTDDNCVPISIYPVQATYGKSIVGYGGYMHSDCFSSSPDCSEPVPIPW